MLNPEHDCWWTRHYVTDVILTPSLLGAAGLPPPVLRDVASALTFPFSCTRPLDDDWNEVYAIGPFSASVHDQCFVEIGSPTQALRHALVRSVLNLHAFYLRESVSWDHVFGSVAALLIPGYTLRFQSIPRKHMLRLKSFPSQASWFSRLRATPLPLAIVGGAAQFPETTRHA